MFARMKRWCLHLSLVLVFTLCGVLVPPAHAQVHFLYRFDTRPPAEIFASGFAPRGGDTNLIRHLVTRNQATAFISTTSSYEAAQRFARAHLRLSGVSGYIYEVAADDAFFEVMPSVESFLAREKSAGIQRANAHMAGTLQLAIDSFRWEREFATTAPIAPSSIYWAVEVRARREADGRLEVQMGRRYDNASPGDHPNTFTNSDTYPVSWPDSAATEPSCTDYGDDAEGAAGASCADDLYAAPDEGNYVHPAMLACLSLSKQKRGIEEAACPRGPPLVNLSRLARAHAALYGGTSAIWPVWSKDEL